MPRKHHQRTLVLNADYTPIGLISWQKAMTLDYKDLVSVVDFYKDDSIVCPHGEKWPVPAVIALKSWARASKSKIPFSRKNVFLRDKLTCQYCNKRFTTKKLTYDHVVPRSKWRGNGTPTRWENIVTCCYPCNHKKANKLLRDCDGMSLIKEPKAPNPHEFILGLAPWSRLQKEWLPYIPKHYQDIIRGEQCEEYVQNR